MWRARCNRFLSSKENDPHRLCVAFHGKSCRSYDRCEEYHDWSDVRCNRVRDNMDKLSLQLEKRERKVKDSSSSSSFSGFSPSMLVPLNQLPSSVGSGVVTMTPFSSVCVVIFLATAPVVSTAPFVSPAGVTPIEPSRKRHWVESPREKEKMLATFEDIWTSGWSFSLLPGPSFVPLPLLVMPQVAVLAPVPSVVPVVVSIRLGSSSGSATSSSQSCERTRSHRSPGPRPVPVQSPLVAAPASRGSWSRRPSGTRSRSRAPSSTRSCFRASSSARSASSAHSGLLRSSFKR